MIKISNTFLPAQLTTRIDYQLNLPQLPKTSNYDPARPNSELMDAANFVPTAPDVTATTTGAALTGGSNAATVMAAGESMTVNVDGNDVVFDFYDGNAGAYTGSNIGIDVQTVAPVSISTALANMQAGLRASGGVAAGDATIGLNGGGNLEITLGTNTNTNMTITDGTTGLGLTDGTYKPIDSSIGVPVPTISAAKADTFVQQSVAGGAITVYASNGSPVNVQLRWAKTDSAARGGTDTWSLYYMSDSTATGSSTMWKKVGSDYKFAADGTLSPDIPNLTLTGLQVNGVSVGNVTLQHNTGGVTQFADPNGTSQVTALTQNGYAAGEFVSATVNDSGRVVATYSNGQQVELAQVVTANFNAPNGLKRLDGGLFAATSESGDAIVNSDAAVTGASLESSNTDISEEFTKLIVTQQAYAAGTRIVSTADQMLQEALNMLR